MDTLSTTHTQLRNQLIEAAGEFAEMFSFNRSLGQIFGLLYISPEPVSLEEIARTCRMSKGNASLHVRTLEGWGAVHRTWKAGTRKDYYSPADDLKKLALHRFQEGMTKRTTQLRRRIKLIKEDPSYHEASKGPAFKTLSGRLNEVESLLEQAELGLRWLPKIFQMKRLLG